MKFVMGLSEKQVKLASCNAFQELKSGQLSAAINALCVLKGVHTLLNIPSDMLSL